MSFRSCRGAAGSSVPARSNVVLRRSALTVCVSMLLAGHAFAQDSATQLDTVQVTGTRSSVTQAQLVKQNAEQIVDSIVAEDIGKLPDNNVAEALQRISGIQIARNFGEGSGIAIRGLTQVRTELNGRDIFTANDGRGLSFEDVSAELLGGVNVYKNPSAEMIEGGLGGTVDLRTRLPFDYEGRKIAGSIQYNHYDLADDAKPAFSGMFSDRWQTGIGEIGLLVNYSQQTNPFRQDTISMEPWYSQTENIPGYEGTEVFVPHGAGANTTIGERKRRTGAFALQWMPRDDIEVQAQVMRSDYDFSWHDYSFFVYSGGAAMQGARDIVLNDRNELVSGVFQNTPADSNTSLTERKSVTTDYSLSAKWTVTPNLTLSTDMQYVDATTEGYRYILGTGMDTTPFYTIDMSGSVPCLSVTDVVGQQGYLQDPANYMGWKFHLDNKDDNKGTEFAWRTDMDLAFDEGFFRSLKAGLRYTDREAENKGGVWRYMWLGGKEAGYGFDDYPNIALVTNPINDFFRGKGYAFGPRLTAADAAVGNYEQTLEAFGASPIEFAPNNINGQNEKTYAAYGVLRFGADDWGVPFDGNVGVRVVRTEVQSIGVRTSTDNEGGGLIPVDVQQSYTDVLPSLNLRWMFTNNLQLRVAASKGISRPGFDRMNPNLSLSADDAGGGGVTRRTGSAGNPALKPMEATQFDTSLEWYFGQGSMVYGTAFYKKVDGFIASATFSEVYDGETWEITRPVNGDDGKIKGVEVGYTQFFDFLPGWLSHFGLQTNYTYVDSEAPSPNASDTDGRALVVPLEGLSKNSYNAILSYELPRFQARVAYNWRSDWLITTAGNGTGNLPVYNKGFGQLDASVRFNINDTWSVSVDGTNLLDTQNESYLGYESRYRDFVINDRRYGITLRASL